MAVTSAELKWYKSSTVTNTDSNGGRSSYNEVVTGVKNNIFQDVSEADRLAGATFYRKVAAKLRNAAGDTIVNAIQHMKSFTPGEDRVMMFAGTQTDTQVEAIAGEPTQKYGATSLVNPVSASDTELVVLLEDTTDILFNEALPDNQIYIGNGGTQEYHSSVAAVKSGTQVTLTLDSGDMLSNNFAVDGTVIASVMGQAVLQPLVDSSVATTVGTGDYDGGGTPIEVSNLGTVKDTFTCVFTSDTEYNCSGAVEGSLGSSNISSDFAPANASGGGSYFTLRSAGWTGVWASGDELVIETSGAEMNVWLKQIVPAGSNSITGNNFTLRHGGESS